MSKSLSKSFRIELNQSLWFLVIALSALGVAEYFKFSQWFWGIALVLTICASAASIIALYIYLKRYNKKP